MELYVCVGILLYILRIVHPINLKLLQIIIYNHYLFQWLDVISRLQSDLDLQLAQIWEDLIGTLKNYQDTTKDLRKEYAALHKKDESALNEINDMMDQAKSDFVRLSKL